MNKRLRKKQSRKMLLVELATHFHEPADAIVWLETAHDQLEGRTPREAIAAGDVDRVTVLLESLDAA